MIAGILIGIAIVIFAMAFSNSAENEYDNCNKKDNNNFRL